VSVYNVFSFSLTTELYVAAFTAKHDCWPAAQSIDTVNGAFISQLE